MPTDLDVYKPERWVDDALFRPEVRDAFRRLVAQGWTDAVRNLHPGERIYTFWDYFRNAWASRCRAAHRSFVAQPSARQAPNRRRRRPRSPRLAEGERSRAGLDLGLRRWPEIATQKPRRVAAAKCRRTAIRRDYPLGKTDGPRPISLIGRLRPSVTRAAYTKSWMFRRADLDHPMKKSVLGYLNFAPPPKGVMPLLHLCDIRRRSHSSSRGEDCRRRRLLPISASNAMTAIIAATHVKQSSETGTPNGRHAHPDRPRRASAAVSASRHRRQGLHAG